MTGYGAAQLQSERWSIGVEVRTTNNRHFKLNLRVSDPYGALELEFERLVRESVRRGSVQLSVRVERPKRAEDFRLNTVALTSYRDQLNALRTSAEPPVNLASLVTLPGVVEERKPVSEDLHEDWPDLAAVVSEALGRLEASRAEEGQAMSVELQGLAAAITVQLDLIEARGPDVIASYQKRILERVQALVAEQGVTVEPKDVIREVAILVDRSDITEEIVRLRAHLAQFVGTLREPESAGRKLEFVVQEMGRETNTIGSKSNDVPISRHVFEIKGILEKIRELIQNVE
jgi:uncharacterized protein (TIGR00255 family)